MKEWLKETDGWTHEKTVGSIIMDSKSMNDISYNCYRIVDTSAVPGDPAKMLEHMLSFREKEWKEFDPSTKVWKLLSENPDQIYQLNGLPWPLSSREFLVERRRFTDEEGEFLVILDANVPNAPAEKGAVKARSVINCSFVCNRRRLFTPH